MYTFYIVTVSNDANNDHDDDDDYDGEGGKDEEGSSYWNLQFFKHIYQ